MFKNATARAVVIVCCLMILPGCDFLDPVRPTAQPDTEIFGNVLDVSEDPAAPGYWKTTLRIGVPRALERADTSKGVEPPDVEEGVDAVVTLGPDSVVLVDGRPSAVSEIPLGTEVVAIPVPGTTFMIGSNRIELDGAYLLDFNTYRAWKLPKLEGDEPVELREDVNLINSSAAEISPVPVNGGSVLYFASHLRPPYREDMPWIGARRDGMPEPGENQAGLERPYRTEVGPEGWSTPESVVFPGLDDALSVRVSWINDAEDRALVSVVSSDGETWVGEVSRVNSRANWGEVQRFEAIDQDAFDAVFLDGSSVKLTYVSTRGGGEQADLFYYDSSTEDLPLPLEPKFNTVGHEWCPRIGPANALFFVRGNRQMAHKAGEMHALRLPGVHRSEFTQAAPTRDGKWLFFCMPGYRPIEPDQDIFVARFYDDFSIGDPVPVDEWRPGE